MEFYRSIFKNYLKPYLIVTVLVGLLIGKLIVDLPYAAVFFPAGLLVFFGFSNSFLKALALFLILLPFSGVGFFRDPVLGMKGTEPYYLLSLFVYVIAIYNYRQSVKMPSYAMIFTIMFLTVYTISVFFSLKNLDIYNSRMAEVGRVPYSTITYILKNYVRPIIHFIPFILTIKFAKKIKDIDFLIKTICLSTTCLSFSVLLVVFLKTGGNISAYTVTESISQYLGMYRNYLANYFIVGFPLLLTIFFVKKKVLYLIGICMCVVAIGFTFSRTAYVVLIFSSLSYLVISKRAKLLPVLLIVALGLAFVMAESIIERASKGIDSGDIDEISAGRVGRIWLPLVNEYINSPKHLLVGGGRFYIISTNAVASGETPDSMFHPHNMYLEIILDTGLLGSIVILVFFTLLSKKLYGIRDRIKDKKLLEYRYGLTVAMISYLLAGMTGRTLLPSPKSCFFWIVVAMAIVIIRITEGFDNKAGPVSS